MRWDATDYRWLCDVLRKHNMGDWLVVPKKRIHAALPAEEGRYEGMCFREEKVIEIVWDLSPQEFRRTALHEICHAFISGHGDEFWKLYHKMLAVHKPELGVKLFEVIGAQ